MNGFVSPKSFPYLDIPHPESCISGPGDNFSGVKVHAAHGGGVTVQCVHASTAFCIPHLGMLVVNVFRTLENSLYLEGSVGGTADNHIICHLTAPNTP